MNGFVVIPFFGKSLSMTFAKGSPIIIDIKDRQGFFHTWFESTDETSGNAIRVRLFMRGQSISNVLVVAAAIVVVVVVGIGWHSLNGNMLKECHLRCHVFQNGNLLFGSSRATPSFVLGDKLNELAIVCGKDIMNPW